MATKKRLPIRNRQKTEPTLLTFRDLSFLKPAKFQDYLTITELARFVGKDVTWIKRLEKEGRIPKAARHYQGENAIRLWSPSQVQEIKTIFQNMKLGRPKRDG